MASEDMDRTEEATPYRLKRAREKGQVAKSPDLAAVIVFMAAVVVMYWQGAGLLTRQFLFDRTLLQHVGTLVIDETSFWWLCGQIALHLAQLLGPVFGAIMLSAVVANLAQTGPLLSFDPISMDWSRLNPAKGIKKLFAIRKLFDAFKATVKLVLLVLIAYLALRELVAQFFNWGRTPPRILLERMTAELAAVGFKMVLVLALVAVVDFFFSRREFAKNMRMSKRDIKDEVKNREGDPRIRSRLRQLRQEMLKRSASIRNTSQADLLIVNPTHFAVALKYVHGEMESPQLLAKGSGAFAAAMRTIAASHEIPVVQNVPLARKLYRELEVNDHVPPNMYADVARIVVWVFAMRRARQAGGIAPLKGSAAA